MPRVRELRDMASFLSEHMVGTQPPEAEALNAEPGLTQTAA